MKSILRIALLFFFIVALLAAPTGVMAQSGDDGKVVLGGTYRLSNGETLNGSLAIFGGEATLEDGSRVNGDVALSGGTLTVQGEINGNIAVLGGTIFLDDTARVNGDIHTIGGQVNRSAGATVTGKITTGPSDLSLDLPRGIDLPNINFDPIGRVLWAGFQSIVLAALAMLVAMFIPVPTRRVADTVVAQPLVSGAIGLLTVLVTPVIIVVLAVTIIMIPLSLLAAFALVAAWVYGMIAIGSEVGRRLMSTSNQNWTPPVVAGVGTLILALVTSFAAIIPCIGWIAAFAVGSIGLGAVLASKFGTQVYAGSYVRPIPPVAVYDAPTPPVRAAPPSVPPSEPPSTSDNPLI